MKKIAVFTGTRAEYGLLQPLMAAIRDDDQLILKLIVSGMHLSPEFGLTWQQVTADGFQIDEKIEILLSSDTAVGVAKSMGVGVLGFADALSRIDAECIVILGDRFEALAMAQTAMIMRVPVVHLHGGEITEGAYDDSIRHAITKLSHLHFASTCEHRRRIIQLGEQPANVFNVGAIGLDHIRNAEFMSREELAASIDFKLDSPFFVVTYHPVTLADEDAVSTFNALTSALEFYQDHKVIVTWPNADDGGRKIIPLIEKWAAENPSRIKGIPSLGYKRYLSAVKYSEAVIGNSSSGIIEVPSLKVATVNIGSRQKGRMSANSVINCLPTTEDISRAIEKALVITKSLKIEPVINPYGDGNTTEKIIHQLKLFEPGKTKCFFDIAGTKRVENE
ncbi:UDP-N-acetylglucosamine 2-epimerase [Erwinia pyri]|uniref:UDP-N-acetylglucosamine 2-epimerase n=1 Tax=Erwinia pyri TaxID=3062598 RepID=A0AA50HPI5_9GAMM|nr:UDP-N-acetylglucosamine 2-epimerase [Erwinia sp. DE2]WLS80302.1 UDP-N-acetylglucosamine 2-epimerase [Erwinia sp. DE2]